MRRRLAVLLLAATTIGGAVTVAHADPAPTLPVEDPTAGSVIDPNPCSTANQASSGATADSCDTQFTPIAKDGGTLFQQVGGAHFNETHAMAGSYTPITVDFYAVRFFDQNNGFAGGAACKDPDTPFEGLEDCERVPVIWQYTNKLGEGSLWREVYRAEDQGFVAAIAFYARGKAIAVGGSGKYPYREFSNDSTSDPDHDPSGKGRIWETSVSRFGDSDWHEYGADQKPTAPNLPADPSPVDVGQTLKAAGANPPDAVSQQLSKPVQTPMRALTALDCSLLEEFCVAGGIQQLFMWHKGAFDKSFGNGSPDSTSDSAIADKDLGASGGKADDVKAAINFRFRVRQLRFAPGETRGSNVISVVGVTSGCCDANAANNLPRVLYWNNVRWQVIGPMQRSIIARLPQSVPDSFYALSVRQGGTPSIVVTPGGPEKPLEPTSEVLGNLSPSSGPVSYDCVGLITLVAASGFGNSCNDAPRAAAI
ncbi:MAG: hypothetical protein QOJ38_220, partial [Solirubrobacterales bacterium]|nr:hypothetical protein [Solirubrobacterales bacterium]